jgi:hypothetical protein
MSYRMGITRQRCLDVIEATTGLEARLKACLLVFMEDRTDEELHKYSIKESSDEKLIVNYIQLKYETSNQPAGETTARQ